MVGTWYVNPRVQAKRTKLKEEKRQAEAAKQKADEEARRKAEAESGPKPFLTNRLAQFRQRTATLRLGRSRTTNLAGQEMSAGAGAGEGGAGLALSVLNRNGEASTASTVVAPPSSSEHQQQQHTPPLQLQLPPPGAFAPESPGFPGSPGTADRGFLSMV